LCSLPRNLTNIPRNLTDEQIAAIGKRSGGMVMINAGSAFLDDESMKQLRAFQAAHRQELDDIAKKLAGDHAAREKATDELYKGMKAYRTTMVRYIDHIEHALKLAPGGVGLGTDFDGVDDPPIGLDDVSYYPKTTEGLLRRGHSEEEIRGVLGESFLRFFARVEETAARLRANK
jgi:membrane dipeptidase